MDTACSGDEFSEHVTALQQWMAARSGRVPRMTGSTEDERHLGRFLRLQVSKKGGEDMPEEQWSQLSSIPGVMHTIDSWVQRPSFIDRVEDVKSWVEEHDGRLPVAGASTATERRLADFVRNQQLSYANGSLSESRKQLLLSVPGVGDRIAQWKFRVDNEVQRFRVGPFEHTLSALKAWQSQHGILPRRWSQSSEERKLYQFLNEQRRCYVSNRLVAERRRQLLKVPGMCAAWPVGSNPSVSVSMPRSLL